MTDSISKTLANLPAKPGVYIMYNKEDTIIYVGKAKVLKNRVRQYFHSKSSLTPKVSAMVSNIEKLEYIVTNTELEALMLECNLIKKHLPKYNILLKDDKGYPYLKVTVNEPFPRILMAHRSASDGARYFGPYLNRKIVKETIDTLKKIFMLRTCNRNLPKDIGKGRACLNYSIKQCSAPCEGLINQEEYKKNFDSICDFIEGNHRAILDVLSKEMLVASGNMEYERAAKFRDKIISIEKLQHKQKIISTNPLNRDIIAYARESSNVCVQIFFVRNGKILGRNNYMLKMEENSDSRALFTDFFKQYYTFSNDIPSTIILRQPLEDLELLSEWLSKKCGSKIDIKIPQRGEKLSIAKLVEENAHESLQSHLVKTDIHKKRVDDILFELQSLLQLPSMPVRIEAYDISNISGQDSVGACVVYENATPKRSAYRKFNIDTVDGPDDYQSMREVLYRRISNGIEGESGFIPLPDLIFMDGGKGHVAAARGILDHFELNIPIFGIVKDDKHRTNGLVTEHSSVDIKRTSRLFKLLANIQDEVHRFAITSHRIRHKKSTINSELTTIGGIGKVKSANLLKHFKSISNIKNADIAQLMLSPGINKKNAENIYNYFHNNANN